VPFIDRADCRKHIQHTTSKQRTKFDENHGSHESGYNDVLGENTRFDSRVAAHAATIVSDGIEAGSSNQWSGLDSAVSHLVAEKADRHAKLAVKLHRGLISRSQYNQLMAIEQSMGSLDTQLAIARTELPSVVSLEQVKTTMESTMRNGSSTDNFNVLRKYRMLRGMHGTNAAIAEMKAENSDLGAV
jgi:hypothetical protein